MSSRTLILIRHAKAVPDAATDHARPLAPRGHADAAEAGDWLRQGDFVPDLALVSDAVRTSETWEDVATAAGWDLAVAEHTHALYFADAYAMLDHIRAVADDVRTLVVVGHNPTVSQVAVLLEDGHGEDGLSQEVEAGFPTSGLAVLEFEGNWHDLAERTARAVGFHVGRG